MPRKTHLLALSGLAVATPLLLKLGDEPGWFAAHGMTSTEVALFACALVLVPALVLWALEGIARIFGRRARWMVHLVLIAALAGLVVMPLLSGIASVPAFVLAGLAGVAFAAGYTVRRWVRRFASLLAVAPVAVLLWFLLLSPAAAMVSGTQLDAWRAAGTFRPPIVVLQLSSLPARLLETSAHAIDARRYPSLAQLARDGVWYRNATAADAAALLDGSPPRTGAAPVVQDHTPNLFTTLGPEYRMNVDEEVTSLCPHEYCRASHRSQGSVWDDARVVWERAVLPDGALHGVPSTTGRLAGYAAGIPPRVFVTRARSAAYERGRVRAGRHARFEAWLAQLHGNGALPELDYAQLLLPRAPFEFLPAGRQYDPVDAALIGRSAAGNRFLAEQGQQRLLLQLGFTDSLVGRVVARLKQLGAYDDAFVVVAGAGGGRVPLIVKYPKGHGPAGVDDRFVRSADIYPTIAGVLGYELPALAGHDLRDPAYKPRPSTATARRLRARERLLARRLRRFGTGADSPYRIGPDPGLVGRSAATAQPPDPAVKATVVNAGALDGVDAAAPGCNCLLAGRITGADPLGMPLAIAVDGRIAATGEGFAARGARRLNWAVMVPPGVFHDGHNTVSVLRIDPAGLVPLGGSP